MNIFSKTFFAFVLMWVLGATADAQIFYSKPVVNTNNQPIKIIAGGVYNPTTYTITLPDINSLSNYVFSMGYLTAGSNYLWKVAWTNGTQIRTIDGGSNINVRLGTNNDLKIDFAGGGITLTGLVAGSGIGGYVSNRCLYLSVTNAAGGDVWLSATNNFAGPNDFSNSIFTKNGQPIATLMDIYEIWSGAMSNLRPTNTVAPSITGDMITNSTVALAFGTFFSVKPSDYVTNQCGVWVDDLADGFWGQKGTSTSYVIPVSLATGSVLYVTATVSNQFGWGTAISAGSVVTNAGSGVLHYRLSAVPTIENGGSGFSAGDKVYIWSGYTNGTRAQLNVDTVSEGVITAVSMDSAGDYPETPGNPASSDSNGGGGSSASFNCSWETFSP